MTDVIQATGLVKRYGKANKQVTALDGLDLTVAEGTVLGLLGPNGAGKTTVVRVLTTLLRPDSGKATVAGVDVLRHPQRVREVIGLSGQYAAVDEHLTGAENLVMVGRLYGMPGKIAKARASELLERFALTDAANRPCKTYSGGMRRRLDLAAALVAQPPVLVLDEPTTGLDPRSRLQMWEVIRDLVATGSTLLLTTQYLEEADKLANHIMVIDRGRTIAHGTADELKAQLGGERIELQVANEQASDQARRLLAETTHAEVHTGENGREFSAPATEGGRTLMQVVQAFTDNQIELTEIGLRRPTLDDVFLTLTGRASEAEQSPDSPAETSANKEN